MNLTYNLKGGKILQNYPSLARIFHLFNVVCVLRIVTFRFASKYHFSFYNAPTFRFAGLKKDQYAYDLLYKIIKNKTWWKTEKIHDYRTILIGRNKKNPSEVAFQLYNPYIFYSYMISPHKNRYDLSEMYFNVCGTFNNTTKEMTVYIKPAGALFYDSEVPNNNIKAEFNDVYFICKLKKTA